MTNGLLEVLGQEVEAVLVGGSASGELSDDLSRLVGVVLLAAPWHDRSHAISTAG
jgi:hypothetical protein